MIKKYKKKISLLLIYFTLFSGNVFASGASSSGGGQVDLVNPIKFKTISELLKAVTNTLIIFGLALIAIMIVAGSILIMSGGAKPKNVTKGKNIITWTVLGVLVVLFARALLEIISYIVAG